MATAYHRVQEFYRSHPGFTFSRIKFKKIARHFVTLFNRASPNHPIKYVTQQEHDRVCEVRNYPDFFTETMDGVIEYSYKEHLKKKKRKRIPAKAASFKPSSRS